jgi:fucose 4-O-acetylase-like acetyltransferase
MAPVPPIQKQRDLTLDIAKGLAIMLVIAGHTLQGSPDFDDLLSFRLIYAFHMPFFIFLAGAVAATRPPPALEQGLTARERAGVAARAIGRSAVRLLIPFLVWTVIAWVSMPANTYTLPAWLAEVDKKTDLSLWFLLLVFECLLLWHIWHLAMGLLGAYLRGKNMERAAQLLGSGIASLLLCAIFYQILLSSSFMPPIAGIGMVKKYFFYFILGALYYLYGRDRLRGVARIIPYAVFIALAPFWYRLRPSEISLWLAHALRPHPADMSFRFVVAVSGIFMMLDIVKLIRAAKIAMLERFLAYCGVASLGIYAIHHYFLGYPPPFLACLLCSLLAYAVLSRIPVVRTILLGETGERSPKIKLSSFVQADKS